jgi:hypothetical protein
MKIKLLKKTCRPFLTDDGENLDYFWYKAIRSDDGVTFQFGSMDGAHELTDGELDLDIEKTEIVDRKGKPAFQYKEVITR